MTHILAHSLMRVTHATQDGPALELYREIWLFLPSALGGGRHAKGHDGKFQGHTEYVH